MKKFLSIGFLKALVAISFAQSVPQASVPSPVMMSFKKQFPTVSEKIKWEKEEMNYEAEFMLKGVETSATFKSDGTLLEVEKEIPQSELPDAAKQYLQSKYPGVKVSETAKITDGKGVVTYEVEIKKMDLIFDSAGTFVKQNK
jgi:hypothetical protein